MQRSSNSLSATSAQAPPRSALRRDGPAGVEEPEFAHPGDARGADRVVAGVVLAAVLGEVGRLGVHRPVRRGVRHVHQERPVRVVARVLPDEAHGVVADRVGVVELIRPVLGVGEGRDQGVVADEGIRVEETAGAVDRAVEAVKAALQGPVVAVGLAVGADLLRHVPLADHVGAVTGRAHGFGEGEALPIQVAAVTVQAAIVHHVPDAGLMRVKPGEERGAGGAAAGGVVELGEAHAAAGEGVQVGGRDLSAVAAEVGVAAVVRHDDDDIRRPR
jgi:hypothetical protein